MKFRALSAAVALVASVAAPAQAANIDVGVSIGISQPGVYGRIDIGRFPQPQLVYAQPVIVAPPRIVVVQPQPVYMWVPPGHRKNWRKHCRRTAPAARRSSSCATTGIQHVRSTARPARRTGQRQGP